MGDIQHSTIYFGLWIFIQIILFYYILLEIYLYLALLAICYYGYQRLAETTKSRISIKGMGVLITGCDTGFGHETALRLDKLGFTVFAGCLLPGGDGAKRLQKTGSKRMHVLHLDVTKDEHVQSALAYVSQKCLGSGLWAVINNAAINRCCDIELASIDLMKRVADINYYGTVRVTKAFINMLRQSGGRVINVSSVRGRVAVPTDVSYTSTKWAMEAFSDILRREMRRFGVNVIVIEPGNFGGITGMLKPETIGCMEQELLHAWDSSSEDTKKAYGKQYIDTLIAGLRTVGQTSYSTMEPVIGAMEDAVTSTSPKYRYLVSGSNKIMDWYAVAAFLNPFLPEAVMDYIIRVFEPLPPVDYSLRLSR